MGPGEEGEAAAEAVPTWFARSKRLPRAIWWLASGAGRTSARPGCGWRVPPEVSLSGESLRGSYQRRISIPLAAASVPCQSNRAPSRWIRPEEIGFSAWISGRNIPVPAGQTWPRPRYFQGRGYLSVLGIKRPGSHRRRTARGPGPRHGPPARAVPPRR